MVTLVQAGASHNVHANYQTKTSSCISKVVCYQLGVLYNVCWRHSHQQTKDPSEHALWFLSELSDSRHCHQFCTVCWPLCLGRWRPHQHDWEVDGEQDRCQCIALFCAISQRERLWRILAFHDNGFHSFMEGMYQLGKLIWAALIEHHGSQCRMPLWGPQTPCTDAGPVLWPSPGPVSVTCPARRFEGDDFDQKVY